MAHNGQILTLSDVRKFETTMEEIERHLFGINKSLTKLAAVIAHAVEVMERQSVIHIDIEKIEDNGGRVTSHAH